MCQLNLMPPCKSIVDGALPDQKEEKDLKGL